MFYGNRNSKIEGVMKYKIGLLAGLAFSLCFCSCSPSTEEVAASYLEGHDAVLYYCGEKSEVFETMKNYHDYTGDNFPEELSEICEFVIDVEYSKSKLTVANLNEMYSAFSNGTYLYVAFINYEDDLALFLAGTKFTYDMESYPHGNPYTRFLTYTNNGSPKFVWNYPMNIQYTNDQQTTLESYQESVLEQYYIYVMKLLMQN